MSAERFSRAYESLKAHLKEQHGFFELLDFNLIPAQLLRTEEPPDWFAAWIRQYIDAAKKCTWAKTRPLGWER